MRGRVLFGSPAGDPFAHGHRMGITAEDYLRYMPASEREVFAETDRFQSALWNEFQNRYPELAADPAATAAAVDYTMAQLKWHDVNPDTWIRQNPEQSI